MPALAMTSPSQAAPTVGIAATLDIHGTQVTISTGDLSDIKKNGLVFSLPAPVVLGSIHNLFDYLEQNLGLPISGTEIQHDIDGLPVPEWLKDDLNSFFNAIVTLTLLNINTKSGVYMFGATMSLASPQPTLLGLIALESIGVVIGSTGKTTSP
jgi:hypothetical protein